MAFQKWLEEEIDWRGQPSPRWRCIRKFVNEGLIPFIETHGYRFAVSSKDLANLLATGFYTNKTRSHLNSVWPCPLQPPNAYEEDESHFHYVLGQTDWDSFWEKWGRWTDVDPGLSFRATDRRMDCEALVWSQIDIQSSPQTQELNEIIAGGEEDEEPASAATPSRPGRQGVDTYILEAAEFGGWGGYRKP